MKNQSVNTLKNFYNIQISIFPEFIKIANFYVHIHSGLIKYTNFKNCGKMQKAKLAT